MMFDMRALDARARYNLITGCVVPRPIALVTSLNRDGSVNAAPFSFFNALGADPPIVAFTPGMRVVEGQPGRQPKDTRRNVERTGEFVVNLVDEALAEAMNVASIEFPPGESEIAAMGVDLLPSVQIATPRIAQSPIQLECREAVTVRVGRNHVVFGEVLAMHVREGLVDAERMHVRHDRLNLIARMPGGSGIYARTRDLFVMPRLTYEEWRAGVTKELSLDDAPQEMESIQGRAAR